MRKRGRPKGAGLTVIGLPKKKGSKDSKPTPFVLKSEWEKTRGISYQFNNWVANYVFPLQ